MLLCKKSTQFWLHFSISNYMSPASSATGKPRLKAGARSLLPSIAGALHEAHPSFEASTIYATGHEANSQLGGKTELPAENALDDDTGVYALNFDFVQIFIIRCVIYSWCVQVVSSFGAWGGLARNSEINTFAQCNAFLIDIASVVAPVSTQAVFTEVLILISYGADRGRPQHCCDGLICGDIKMRNQHIHIFCGYVILRNVIPAIYGERWLVDRSFRMWLLRMWLLVAALAMGVAILGSLEIFFEFVISRYLRCKERARANTVSDD